MGILGTIVLAFIVGHMADFWREYHWPDADFPKMIIDGVEYKDLYKEVIEAFHVPALVGLYVVAMAAISFHLHHGFQSAFQTLGLNHVKYTPIIKSVGAFFSIVVPAAYAFIPVYIFLFIKG